MAGSRISFGPATAEHIDALIPLLRPLDRDEVVAAVGEDFAPYLHSGLRSTDQPVVGTVPEGLLCVFGVVPDALMGDTAVIWLLGTDLMRKYAADVVRDTRRFVVWARERYPKLHNYVDARNTPSIRWLAGVGFTLDPPVPYGVAGLPFHRFHMGFDHV